MDRIIKVWIVDSSALGRQLLAEALRPDPGVVVLGTVVEPRFALARMRRQWPDVLLLDLDRFHADALTLVGQIMSERPTPIVVSATWAEAAGPKTIAALASGAVGFLTKPQLGLKQFYTEAAASIVQAVKAAGAARVHRAAPALPVAIPRHRPKYTADVILDAPTVSVSERTERIVALGTSAGGTQALERVLPALPRTAPGLVIVQHMPEKFTAAFARRLNGLCEIQVREARNGDLVTPGLALIAPGGRHLLVRRHGAGYAVEVVDGPLVSRHKPSVDVLFRSVAKFAGKNALGILLTGMGDDGATGLLEMRGAGARTVAQDEASSTVYGMPKEAARRGAAERILPLDAIPQIIVDG
jgi:two-component system chemotaxis response regulator CheB